jgi:hypothetical protein
MKNIFTIDNANSAWGKHVWLLLSAVFCHLLGHAQGCINKTRSDWICPTDAWNWEVRLEDPDYCDTWSGSTDNSGYLARMGSPFVVPTSGQLSEIALTKDYAKANGWELVARDFGCRQAIATPYFALYNRSKGLVRVYIYQAPRKTYSKFMATVGLNNAGEPHTLVWRQPLEMTEYDDAELTQKAAASGVCLVSAQSNGPLRWFFLEIDLNKYPALMAGLEQGRGMNVIMYGVVVYTFDLSLAPSRFQIYPVPAADFLTLRIRKDLNAAADVTLRDLLGRVVWQAGSSEVATPKPVNWEFLGAAYATIDWANAFHDKFSVPVSSLPAGVYFLRYTSAALSFDSKVVVAR